MSVRCGHIMRLEDLHGVSGTGKIADVFEASNGKCIVVWISAHSSTNIYDNVKHVESTHSHGGKTLVIWDWESPPDPDPMDALKKDDIDKPEFSAAEIEEISKDEAEDVQKRIAHKIAEKLSDPAPIEESPEKKEEERDEKT